MSKGEGGVVFDAAMQRWMAMKATEGEFFYPTMRSFIKVFGLFIVPMSLGCWYHYHCEVRRGHS